MVTCRLSRVALCVATLFGLTYASSGQTPSMDQVVANLSSIAGSTTDVLQARISLVNCGNGNPVVIGVTLPVKTTALFTANSSGEISGSLWGNDAITCNGTASTLYQVTYLRNNVPAGVPVYYRITSSVDLGTAPVVDVLPPTTPLAAGLLCPAGQVMAGILVNFTPVCQFISSIGVVSGSGGTMTAITGVNANGFTVGTSASATNPTITINTDATHVLPTNTGPTTEYLNAAGLYSTPPGGNAVTIQSYAVDPTAPVSDAALIWDAATNSYNVRPLTQDDIQAGFAITGFSGGSTVEIGATVTNPTFSASYSTPPTSASITNTAGIGSPLVLSSPFSSGTVVGSFTATSQMSVGFTLTAVGATTKTASQNIAWIPRSFGGVGAASATSTVTSSGLNAVLSTGDTLASAGLAGSDTGGVYGPYTASAQKIYLLLQGGSHTFKDNVTGFAFAFNAPTAVSFVNVYGATVTMYLYESTYLLTGAYSVLVVS